MKKIFYLIQFLFILILFLILKLLPLNFSKILASILFRNIGKLTSAHKTAADNCKFVFPKLEKLKVINLINNSWNNIAINICELLKFKILLNKNKILINGLENIEKIKKNNKQAIFIGIHQSNWEILVPMIERLDLKICGIYRHINNFFLDKMILKIRKNTLLSNENFYTPKGRQSAKDLIEALNNGFSIVLLIDQKDSAGEDVVFFNKLVKTQIGFLKIARKFNLPIIPVKNTRLDDGKIELDFQSPVYHNDTNINDVMMMQRIHKTIEAWIIANPSQWF